MMDKDKLIRLLDRDRKGILTEHEKLEMQQWLAHPQNATFYEKLQDEHLRREKVNILEQYDTNTAFAKTRHTIDMTLKKQRRVKAIIRLGTVAACLIALSVLSIHIAQQNDGVDQLITPGKDIATLTLEDGSVVSLGEGNASTIGNRSDMRISVDSAGHPIFELLESSENKTGWHTVSTPNGGQYIVKLPDRSVVYLNAGSSISYPVNFLSNRKIKLTGEAYFEVEKRNSKDGPVPFEVHLDNHHIQVLGTQFNVNSYAASGYTETTLVNGSIKVIGQGIDKILSPGQQIILDKTNKLIQLKAIDPRLYVDWKDGYFYFDDMSITQIMRKIAKWYDVEIVYSGEITNEKFGGEVSRSSNLQELLQLLELTDKVHFKTQGRRVTVMP